MKRVRAFQGDTIDLIAHRHYGDTSMVEAIFEANPRLADLGVILPQGTLISLPQRTHETTTGITLWD